MSAEGDNGTNRDAEVAQLVKGLKIHDSNSHHKDIAEKSTEEDSEDGEDVFTEEDLGASTPGVNTLLATPKPTDDQSLMSHREPEGNVSEDTISTTPTDLDALLSPTHTYASFSFRQSVAASDTTDDDARFSTVLLRSARQSLDPDHTPDVDDEEDIGSTILALDTDNDIVHDERRDTLDGSELIRLVHTNRTHKKTASTSTIVSGIVSRLEADDTRRTSFDGQQMLQEEFGRKQEVLGTSGSESDIDWSMLLCHFPSSFI